MKRIYTGLVFLITGTLAFGQIAGTWQLAPEAQALAVGPAQGDFSWWSNTAGEVEVRACLFDDQFVFEEDGTFRNVQDGSTWLEVWQGASEDSCGEPVAPHDGSNSATWTYDGENGTLTLDGVGAHVGLAKVVNGAEITSPDQAPQSISYPVVLSEDGERMTIDIDFGAGFWHFVLVKTFSTSVDDLDAEELFAVFPNPASEYIQVTSRKPLDEVRILDVSGRTLIARLNPMRAEAIDISALPAGVLLVESRSGDQTSVKKLFHN